MGSRWSKVAAWLFIASAPGCSGAIDVTLDGPKPSASCTAEPYTPPPIAGDVERECKTRVSYLAHNDMPHNDMPHNDMPHNALSADSLRGHHALLTHLSRTKLDEGTFRGHEALLADDNAKALMAYIASCALDPASQVNATVDTARLPYGDAKLMPPWKGEMGLCGKGSPAGEWSAGPPTPQCLELVSSCLLARTNALGRRVILSVRGEPSCLFPLHDKVPVETSYREHRGTPIAAFAPCRKDDLAPDIDKDCGYTPLYVGRCEAGETVKLTAERPGRLRVCKGLYGCGAGPKAPYYAGIIPPIEPETACGKGEKASVSFTCPNNGPAAPGTDLHADRPRWGYYSVMSAPCKPSERTIPSPLPTAVKADKGSYPAPEAEVFTYREGGFYGNVFPPAAVAGRNQCEPPIQGKTTMLSGELFACYSDVWSRPLAHLADRLCADPESSECFGNQPLACLSEPDARCRDGRGAGGSYRLCKGDDRAPAWPLPITVYLNHPCDLSNDPACKGSEIGKPPFVPPQK